MHIAGPKLDADRLRRGVVSAGRTLITGYGELTAQSRPDPDFLIIGTKRGGTTSFYFDLLGHTQVCPLFPRPDHLPKAAPTKGIHFFDQNYHRGERWYRAHLPSSFVRRRQENRVDGPVITGEASPYYLFHPAAAQRAAGLVPGVKLILLLRDPVMRTYSHWKERRRNQAEDLDFSEALAAEDERIAGTADLLRADPAAYSYAHEQQSYARQSEYDVALQEWLKYYDRNQVLVLASESYYTDPQATLDRALAFLDLPTQPIASGKVRNAARGDDLPIEQRASLAERFAPHIANLERMTGERFPWSWSQRPGPVQT